MKIKPLLNKAIKYFTDDAYRFSINSYLHFYDKMDDEKFLKRLFYYRMNKPLDLDNPKTFNEKLQWLKLYDRKPEYTMMVDKYEVKKYVADKIGEEYIIPTYGVWDKFEDIDFDKLPQQFVLKCTHDSGGLVICRDKSKFNIKKAENKINKSLSKNYYYANREWPYKNVKPRIIAEKYIECFDDGGIKDYKFFCFDGVCKMLFVASDRQKVDEETKFDFFDIEFNHLNLINFHPNAEKTPEKPKGFYKMFELAEMLSVGIPHARIDFYDVDGKVYFGEITFFHFSGLVPFEPQEWDKKLGDMIKLPAKN